MKRKSLFPLLASPGFQLVMLALVAVAAYHGLVSPDAGLGLTALGVVTIPDLQARLKELHDISTGIQAKADAEGRDLTVDEQKELDSVMDEFEQVELDVKRRQRVEAQAARLAVPGQRLTPPAQVAANGLQNTVLSTVGERNRWGFRNMGDFAMAVRGAVVHPSSMDQRLQNAALSTASSEAVGADGGFAVPPEWRAEIMRLVDAEDSFLSDTDQQPVSGNTMSYPTDETSAHQGSGGIQVYWDGESDTINQSKVALKDLTVKLHRLTALVPMTEELLEDAPALGAYVTGKAGEKFAFKLNDAIINGTGVGMPLGVMNAPCKVTVAKEATQTTGTIHADNISKMMARMQAKSFKRAKWYVNQDCLPQIMKLGFVIASASGTVAGAAPMYQAPNGLPTMGAYGTLLGRPIEVTEACQALGTEGDIILGDMSKYLAVVKTGGVKTDVSIHLWFDQNTTAFRFVLRMNGQPWLSAPIARKNGSNTLSHFVTLQTR